MAQIVKELRVDVSQPNVFQAIVAKQHDSNSRFLKITLVDFGVKVEVPNTAKVTINANRPDGASESFKGEANNDGTITVPLAQWMLDIDGEVKCDVSVTNTEDNKRLTSTDFWLEVQKAANPNASIPLDPDGEILIIKPVTEINENSKDADYPSAKAVYDYGQSIAADTQITATATGSAITIDSANAPLQKLKLYGKTTQDGTPTPDNPIELKNVGDSGSYSVDILTSNLITLTDYRPDSTITEYDGKQCVKYTTGSKREFAPISFKANTQYTVRFDCKSVKNDDTAPATDFPFAFFYSDGTNSKISSTSDSTWRTFTLTSQANKTVVGIGHVVYDYRVCNYIDVNSFVFVEGTSITKVEPYNKQSMTFTDTLRGIGDIADEKDFARGVTTQRFGIVDLGTLDWGYNSNDKRFSATLTNSKINTRTGKGLCSIYNVLSNSESYAEIKNNSIYTGASRVNVHDNRYTDVTAFKSAMSGIKFIYELETPIETPLTETELNAYRQLHTNKPNTTILSEADMEVDYYINKHNAQAIGNIHSQVNKDYFKLQQAIISTGGSTL